jgi:hypothetical protein
MPGTEAAPAAAPGVSELFAALVAAVKSVAEEGTATPEGETEQSVTAEQPESDTAVDAAILLPMLDQQRAALPSAALVTTPPIAVAAESTAEAAPAVVGRREPGSPDLGPARAEFQQRQTYGLDSGGPVRTGGTGLPLQNGSSEPGKSGTSTATAREIGADAATGMSADQVRGHAQGGEAGRIAAAYNVRTGSGVGAANPAALDRTGSDRGGVRAVPISGGGATPAVVGATVLQSPIAQLLPQGLGATGIKASPTDKGAARSATSQGIKAAVPANGAATPPELMARLSNAAPAPIAASLPIEGRQEPIVLDQTDATQLLRESAAPAPTAATPVAAPLTSAPAGPVQNLGAAIAAQVLDLAKGGEWIDEVARDIARSASSEGAMRFRLTPETLGELRVEITQTDRGAHVRLVVSSEAAQQALAEAQPKLVQEARAHGVRIAEAEVSLSGGQSQGRDPGRQASSDQPMRSFRSAPDHHSTTGDRSQPARRGRTDLYA